MGDEDEGARELEQALLEHLEGRDVEVVRGLVEEQQVGGLEHQPGEHRARLLAAGQPAHRRLELLGAEEEALRPARDVNAAALEDDRVAVRGQRALERDLGVETRAVLVEHHDLEAGGVLDRARVGRLLPGQEAKERALAGAVRAEEAEARPRREDEVEAAHDVAVPVALGQPLGHHEPLRLALRRREVEPHGRGLRARVEVRELVLQALRLVDARLRLAGARAGLAREPVELAPHPVAERLLVGRLPGQQLVLLLQEPAVAPAHVEEAEGERAVELDHAPRHRLEEVAVVAHRHEGLRLARQQLLEPEDAVHVEVVRGLVEEEELRLADQGARDREPLLPAAGEDPGRLLAVGEAGLPHRHRDLPVDLVLVQVVVPERLAQDGEDGRPGVEDRVLRHVADPQALARGARAGRGLLEAGQDLQECRLAGAVRAHEADVVALEDAERQALEERRRAEGLRDLLAGDEQLSHGSPRRPPGPPCRPASAA